MFALVSCGGEDITASLQDQVGKAMEEHAAETSTETAETNETAEATTGTWKAWADSYSNDMDGQSATLSGVVEKVTNYEDLDGNESIMAQFGVEGMMKCAITAHFGLDMNDALKASKKDGTPIDFTGTVEEKSAFDGIVIKDCKLN